MNNRVTFQKVATGQFDVYLDGVKTNRGIVNGSLGLSGLDKNMYGIVRGDGSVKWIGTLQSCKKILTFTLTKEAK